SFNNVRAGYGEAVVLDDISFAMPERGSLAVLGRNGVGKSTLLLTLMGFTQLRRGAIVWRGTDITRLAPHRRAQSGIGWVALERGAIVHRARSADLLKDHATLDRYIGLRVTEGGAAKRQGTVSPRHARPCAGHPRLASLRLCAAALFTSLPIGATASFTSASP